jgi:hypothetical protein
VDGLSRVYRFDDVPVMLVPPRERRTARTVCGVIRGSWTGRLARGRRVEVVEVNAFLYLPSLANVAPPDSRGDTGVTDVSAIVPLTRAVFPLSTEHVDVFGQPNLGWIDDSGLIVTTLGLEADLSIIGGFFGERVHVVLRVTGFQDGPSLLTMAGVGMVLTGAFALTIICCAGPRGLARPETPEPQPPVPAPPETPVPVPQPAEPCVGVAVPDTDATIADAIQRIGRDQIHSNNRAGLGRQGNWTKTPLTINGMALPDLFGVTCQFIKLELGVGCTPPSDWKIGIKDVDLQFRIALSPRAALRQAADDGRTPGGFAGVLGHEAEHGEAAAYVLGKILDRSYPTAGQFWNLVDQMRGRVYRRRADAEAAAADYRRRLMTFLKDQVSAFAAKHDDTDGAVPDGTVYPRLQTAEPLDNSAQTRVADEIPLVDLKSEMRALLDSGYEFMGTRLDGLP